MLEVVIFLLGFRSYSQIMIRMSNHLIRMVFRFHETILTRRLDA